MAIFLQAGFPFVVFLLFACRGFAIFAAHKHNYTMANAVNDKIGVKLVKAAMAQLQDEKGYYKSQMNNFNRMFNELVPEGEPVDCLKYSPLQQYFQERAQHYAQQYFFIDSEIIKLQSAVDTTVFD